MKTATDTSLPKIARPNAARHATSANYSAQITSILVPIDFSNASTKALKYAIALARQYGAKITPLFVTELPEIVGIFQLILNDDEIKTTFEAKLLKFARKASAPATMIDHALVRKGRPHREIVEAARTLKSDLIVISTHGYSAVTRALLGSVTERVVREAPCPVLVVREQEREFVKP
jgi:nucleotide-binding universal stress UspA family protein